MKKAKRKGRVLHMRFRKNDVAHNLLAAVQHYVKANGGSVLVIGGIYVIADTFDSESKFKIAVGCLGKRPVKPETK